MRSLTRVFCAAACGTLVVAGSGSASAAGGAYPPLPVLRHLTFSISTSVEKRTDTKVSGIDGPASGTATDDTSSLSAGTISVDVVAVTADGGIVLDVSEDADQRKAAVTRIAVLGSSISYDASRGVTEEELAVARLLSRSFLKPDELSVGTTWTDDMKTGASADHAVYKVTAVDDGAKTVDLAVDESMSQAGADGFTGTTRGTVTYDVGVSVPRAFALWTRLERRSINQLSTTDLRFNLALKADSMHKASGS